ncbi:MAG: hypothetical protein C4K47_03910 [Candidatus Thorarchaeota archaeon]|nr:MAG: hypothetical protein C4K47_03910 [Candidatus Thorarchaeota archaeon]
MVSKQPLDSKRIWIKRAAYLALATGVLVGMPLVLVVIADLTGVIHFSEIFGPLVWWNELSGPSFVVAFFAILLIVAVIIYFLAKMFDTSQGAW